MRSRFRPVLFRPVLFRVLFLLGALVASSLTSAPAADAMSGQARSQVLHVAASKRGAPYRYGAAGPRAFDCSGYTQWVFARVGRHLPRTSRAQAGAARHVAGSRRRTGDLVFFHHHGRVYHVAIYAGGNRIWHAPRSGERVRLERIWTRSVSYGRVA